MTQHTILGVYDQGKTTHNQIQHFDKTAFLLKQLLNVIRKIRFSRLYITQDVRAVPREVFSSPTVSN